jgi:hypothetical protein
MNFRQGKYQDLKEAWYLGEISRMLSVIERLLAVIRQNNSPEVLKQIKRLFFGLNYG